MAIEALNMTPDPAKEAFLRVDDLVKTYRGRRRQDDIRAVRGLSFSLAEGEFFGFLGPNGSGKSTTIKIIATLLAKTSGSVTLAGYDLDRDPAAIRKTIGYTGQSVGVDGDLTGRENLTLIGRFYGLHGSSLRTIVDELLEVLQLTDAAGRVARTYSGGMRRRLDLGSGLIHRPQFLFLDEPTTGLDPQTRNAMWEYLRRLHREDGTTIFLTTQYMEEADRLCERLAIIDNGKIVAEGTPADLKSAVGADVVTIRIPKDERFEAARDQAQAVADEMDSVDNVVPFDGGVSVYAQKGGATLLEILRRLEARQVSVAEVAVSQPSLDEVFLQHTGRAMQVELVKPPSRLPITRRR